MPHEPSVRAWLARSRAAPEDIDDFLQEAYCRIAALDNVDHIDRADAYFFSIVRNLAIRKAARAKVVPLVPISELGDFADDKSVSPERTAAGRLDYARMLTFLHALPERRRRIVEMRKLEARSQREIAEALSVTENVVEHEVRIGMVELLRAWRKSAQDGADQLASLETNRENRA
jgi:RNA polymerase sigma-70 factor (ECF subfamily)